MISKLTIHDTPQHNGVAECHNRTIVECIWALLYVSGLLRTMWGEAACHVIWLMNHTRTKVVRGATLYEAAFGKKFDLSDVCEWGEKVWVHLEKGKKFGGRVKDGCWMGILDELKGVCVYWPDKKTVSTERNVYFSNMQSSVSHLKGEDLEFTKTKSDNPPVSLHNPSVQSINSLIISPQTLPDITSKTDEDPPEPKIPTKCIHKPTTKLKEIIELDLRN